MWTYPQAGIRNSVLDLTQFPDWKEVMERFPAAAATQFQYEDSLFALPETITYPVMFYRKDILKEIGLALPETWDDVKVAMTVLAKNQMEFGMLPTESLPYCVCVSAEVHHFKNSHASSGYSVSAIIMLASPVQATEWSTLPSGCTVPGICVKPQSPAISGADTAKLL